MSDSLTAMPDADAPSTALPSPSSTSTLTSTLTSTPTPASATSSMPDPNTTPVVTQQPPPQLTPPSVAPLSAPDARLEPLPTGVMPRPQVGRAENISAPVVAVVPKLDDAPGPITKRQRAFFASTPRVEVSGAKRSPPLVPLPKKPANLRPSEQVEMSGGVLGIERTSPAWIATAAVTVAGVVIALVLGLDASLANEKLVAKEAEAAALAKRVAELEIPKVVTPTAPMVAAAAGVVASAKDPQPLVDALRARIPAELTRGEVRVVAEGNEVRVSLEGLLDKKGKLTKKAPELLGRVGAALGPLVQSVQVAAYSDGNVGRGKSEWGQSAARATNVARALAENAKALDTKKVAVVGKGAAPKGVSARRIDILVTTR